jgi:hypothetical protein
MTGWLGAVSDRVAHGECQVVLADRQLLADLERHHFVPLYAIRPETTEWARRRATGASGFLPKNGERRRPAPPSPVEFGAESRILRRI